MEISREFVRYQETWVMVGAAIEKCRNSTGNVFGMIHFGMVGTERENVASLTENAFDNDKPEHWSGGKRKTGGNDGHQM